jgi:hypothetical protein
MTSCMNSRRGFTAMFAAAAMMAIVVAGSVWAMGNGEQRAMAAETPAIDVAFIMISADTANLPVLLIEDPI